MNFLKKKYFSIICLIILFSINFVLIKYINNDTSEIVNEINYLKVLQKSLSLPAVYLLVNIFTNRILSNKQLFIFTIVLITLSFIMRYFKGKYFIDYNYTIGTILGLIFAVFISSIIKKFNIEKLNQTESPMTIE